MIGWLLFWIAWTLLVAIVGIAAGVWLKSRYDDVATPVAAAKSGITSAWQFVSSYFGKKA